MSKKEKWWREVELPEPDVEYWVVYNPKDELPHYFLKYRHAEEYASWNDIPDINIFKECFN